MEKEQKNNIKEWVQKLLKEAKPSKEALERSQLLELAPTDIVIYNLPDAGQTD